MAIRVAVSHTEGVPMLLLAELEQDDLFRDPRTVDRVCRLWAQAEKAEQNLYLDAAARHASQGSRGVLDLLLTLVDQHRLAIPAIRRTLADDGAVEDVAQDVLVALANSIGSFRGGSAFRTWLFSVARNQTFLYLRRQSRGRDDPPADERPSQRVSSLVANREVLGSALDELPDVYRSAVILRDVEQLTYDQIAKQLDIQLNTVKSRIARGRALIAAGIAEF